MLQCVAVRREFCCEPLKNITQSRTEHSRLIEECENNPPPNAKENPTTEIPFFFFGFFPPEFIKNNDRITDSHGGQNIDAIIGTLPVILLIKLTGI